MGWFRRASFSAPRSFRLSIGVVGVLMVGFALAPFSAQAAANPDGPAAGLGESDGLGISPGSVVPDGSGGVDVAGGSGEPQALSAVGEAGGFGEASGSGGDPKPGSTHVSPRRVLFDGKRAVSLRYAFRGSESVDIRVRVISATNGRMVRSWIGRGREPGTRYVRNWNGIDDRGDPVPVGRYRFRFGPAGTSRQWAAGSFVLRDYVYPIAGPHSDRGPVGEFGGPRSGGRTHEGFDILADCGTPLVAARGGDVLKAGFDPVLFGWFVLIDGRQTKRDSFYSHLRDRPRVAKGDRVRTGERIGKVGQTGNARSTPCHLHFELRTPGGPIDPEPALRLWDRWS